MPAGRKNPAKPHEARNKFTLAWGRKGVNEPRAGTFAPVTIGVTLEVNIEDCAILDRAREPTGVSGFTRGTPYAGGDEGAGALGCFARGSGS